MSDNYISDAIYDAMRSEGSEVEDLLLRFGIMPESSRRRMQRTAILIAAEDTKAPWNAAMQAASYRLHEAEVVPVRECDLRTFVRYLRFQLECAADAIEKWQGNGPVELEAVESLRALDDDGTFERFENGSDREQFVACYETWRVLQPNEQTEFEVRLRRMCLNVGHSLDDVEMFVADARMIAEEVIKDSYFDA